MAYKVLIDRLFVFEQQSPFGAGPSCRWFCSG